MIKESNPGYFILSPKILIDRLPLPADTEIIGARWDEITRQILIFVKHPYFPKPEEGYPLQESSVMVTTRSRKAEPDDMIVTYSSEFTL